MADPIEKWKPFSSMERWEPFKWFSQMQEEMNRRFEEALQGRWLEPFSTKGWYPSVDVMETKDEMVIRADLPGMKQSDIDISVSNGILTIKGERKEEKETKEENFYRKERSYGAFSRSMPLPAGVDADKIKASYKEGVLEVKFPKPEETKAKQIKIG
jgi:HSP20 family protein